MLTEKRTGNTLDLPPASNADAGIKFAIRLFEPLQKALILIAGCVPVFDDVVKQFPDYLLELSTPKGLQYGLLVYSKKTQRVRISPYRRAVLWRITRIRNQSAVLEILVLHKQIHPEAGHAFHQRVADRSIPVPVTAIVKAIPYMRHYGSH